VRQDRPHAGLAIQFDLVFSGSVNLRAEKHETMEGQNRTLQNPRTPEIGP